MPRFYFDVQTSSNVVRDPDGVDAVDGIEALRGFIDAIDEVMRADAEWLIIRDEQDREIAWFNIGALRASPDAGSTSLLTT